MVNKTRSYLVGLAKEFRVAIIASDMEIKDFCSKYSCGYLEFMGFINRYEKGNPREDEYIRKMRRFIERRA